MLITGLGQYTLVKLANNYFFSFAQFCDKSQYFQNLYFLRLHRRKGRSKGIHCIAQNAALFVDLL